MKFGHGSSVRMVGKPATEKEYQTGELVRESGKSGLELSSVPGNACDAFSVRSSARRKACGQPCNVVMASYRSHRLRRKNKPTASEARALAPRSELEAAAPLALAAEGRYPPIVKSRLGIPPCTLSGRFTDVI